jgi:hypothetical protein
MLNTSFPVVEISRFLDTSNSVRRLIKSKQLRAVKVGGQYAIGATPASTSRDTTFHQNRSESRTAGTGSALADRVSRGLGFAIGEYSFRLG